jgi:hypothetical protein
MLREALDREHAQPAVERLGERERARRQWSAGGVDDEPGARPCRREGAGDGSNVRDRRSVLGRDRVEYDARRTPALDGRRERSIRVLGDEHDARR